MEIIVKRIFIMFTYILYAVASYGIVKGWSCPSMSKIYSKIGDDIILRFTVSVTDTPAAFSVYSYNTYIGSIVIYSEGFVPSPVTGINISGDVTGNINITVPKVQISSAGIYRIESPTTINQCRILYILRKPSKPSITANRKPAVGENVSLTCNCTSNTTPSNHSITLLYTWKINNTQIKDARYTLGNSGTTLLINDTKRHDSQNNVTCTTREDVVDGFTSESSSNFTLEVQYGPYECVINTSSPYIILEGNTSSTISCQSDCNPLCTCMWTNISSGAIIGEEGNITLEEATRYYNGNYTCNCTNIAVPRFTCSKNFHVAVEYASFFIKSREGQEEITIDEYEAEVQFICEIYRYWKTTIQIMLENVVLKQKVQSTSLSFTRSSFTCLHAGVYTCNETSQHETALSKTIHLFVRCSPRPFHQLKHNVTGILNTPVMLSFQALAYPKPGPTGFNWHKENGMRWTPLRSNADLRITSSDLQSNLSILNVSNVDYGQYRVTATNDVGSYEQYVFLVKEGTEETTRNEENNNNSKTETVLGTLFGVVVAALASYAAYVTFLLRRARSKRGTQLPSGSAEPTKFVNQLDNYETTGEQSQSSEINISSNCNKEEDGIKLYSDLARYSKGEGSAYELI